MSLGYLECEAVQQAQYNIQSMRPDQKVQELLLYNIVFFFFHQYLNKISVWNAETSTVS